MVTFEEIKQSPEVKVYLQMADDNFAAIGYKEHGFRHAITSALVAGYVLESLKYSEKEVELAKIAALLHDIGNAIGRAEHTQTSAILALRLLSKLKVPYSDIFKIVTAIGNHEEREYSPPNAICAATILGDKSDVHRMRVRKTDLTTFDMHDRVNYAATESNLSVDQINKVITLKLTIDTKICSVMEYFEIFTSRMKFCKLAANFLDCDFELYINGDKMF
ncbi:MAG: HD domain-containing protein [Elusimicrobiota bacterium]|nr:HD domain-containing protein [Elusimicrobiota bacterium]